MTLESAMAGRMPYLWLALLLLASPTFATSSAVATAAIVTTYTSTYYSTTSSVVTSTASVETSEETCGTSVDSSGSTVTTCVSGAAATEVPVYENVVNTLTTTIESTVGYSTIYSGVPDSTSSAASISSTTSTRTTSSSSISETPSSISGERATSTKSPLESSASSGSYSSSSLAAPAAASTSSGDPSDKPSSNSLGPKVALAVAIFVGLIFLSLAVGYIIKRHRDRRFKRSIGAPEPGSLEKGSIAGFVATNELKKTEASTTTLSTIPESRPATATPRAEATSENFNDPTIIGASFSSGQGRQVLPPQRPSAHEAPVTPVFEAPSRPSISADELPPRTASLHQRRASTESARTARTAPVEADGDGRNETCSNPFHEGPCTCRNSILIGPGRDSVYDAFGRPRHQVAGDLARFEGGDDHFHEEGGHEWSEAPGTPRHEMSAMPVVELADTSEGIGMAR